MAHSPAMRRAGLAVPAVIAVLALGCGRKERADDAPVIAGLPAIDHAWTPAELTAAAAILDELCTTAPDRMPALGDRVFARVVAADNRGTLAATPPTARQADVRQHNAALLRVYATYQRCGRPSETMAANAALLEGYAVSLAAGKQVIAALPADDPARAPKQKGLDQMAAGLAGGVGSTVGMLADPAIEPPPVEVADRLGRAIAAVRAELPAGALDEPLARLTDATAGALDPPRKAALDAVAAPLR